MLDRRGLLAASAACLAAPRLVRRARAADAPFRIGLLLDMAGVNAGNTGPGSVTATKMAVADFGGQVLGRPIEVKAADHKNLAETAVTLASDWFDNQQVSVMMDVANTPPALAVMNVAKQRRRIVFVNGAGAESITNTQCSPFAVHYTYNTYAVARGVTQQVAKPGQSWFFVSADYAFGTELEQAATDVVQSAGGHVLGHVKVPIDTADQSAMLLAAQGSGADIIALSLGGNDLVNALKQAAEFGIARGGHTIIATSAFLNNIQGAGLQVTQGMLMTCPFYWDMTEATRGFANRFFKERSVMPNEIHAGTYSATLAYLRAVQATGTDEAGAVMTTLHKTPIEDLFAHNGHIRADGMMVHDMFLMRAKTPAASHGPWDLLEKVGDIPGEQAYLPLDHSRCPLLKGL